MNTLRIENLQMNTVLDREARSAVDGGGWFTAIVKVATYGYSAYKKRKTIKKYARKGYGYAKKAWNWIF